MVKDERRWTRDDEPRTKDNKRQTMHTMIGGGDECFMDRQYEYVFAGDSDHHGFLSHDPGRCTDPLVKKRIGKNIL